MRADVDQVTEHKSVSGYQLCPGYQDDCFEGHKNRYARTRSGGGRREDAPVTCVMEAGGGYSTE